MPSHQEFLEFLSNSKCSTVPTMNKEIVVKQTSFEEELLPETEKEEQPVEDETEKIHNSTPKIVIRENSPQITHPVIHSEEKIEKEADEEFSFDQSESSESESESSEDEEETLDIVITHHTHTYPKIYQREVAPTEVRREYIKEPEVIRYNSSAIHRNY